MQLALTGVQVLTVLGLITLCLIGSIYGTRYILHHRKGHEDNNSPIIKKYLFIDVLRRRFRSSGIAASLSIAAVVILMSWTTYTDQGPYTVVDYTLGEEEVIPPITFSEPKLPPPVPPAPPIIEVLDNDLLEEPDFEPLEVDDDIPYQKPSPKAVVEEPPVFTPPPLPEPKEDELEIYPVAEQMPLFGECEDRACSDQKLLSYLSREVRYPTQARDNGIEGRVYVRFVVEKDGSVGGITILRGVGAGCDKEVVRVIEKMNELKTTWKPGKQRGVKVRVMYTLPVTFKINQ